MMIASANLHFSPPISFSIEFIKLNSQLELNMQIFMFNLHQAGLITKKEAQAA